MGLFAKKPMYKYKPLERVRINIAAVNATFLSANPQLSSYEAKEYCELIGETDKYRVYIYQRTVSGSDGYFLRQAKASPKNVAYLGRARKYCCVFHDKLFTIDSFSSTNRVNHPLICKDINTGVQTEMNVLSDKGFREHFGASIHLYCQDVVHSLTAHNDVMTLEIYRYPAGSILTGDTYHEECIYHLHIKYVDGKFSVAREFPQKQAEMPPKPHWRDDTGKISCPGDNCSIDCNKSCPIWLNSVGLSMLRMKKYDEAALAFNDALAIAPDFLDVQNNLGTAYGMNNQHQKAYEAFKKAHEMKKDYPKALHGLIVAETNLGMVKEALAHCDEYDRLPSCDSSALRERLVAHPEPETPSVKYIDIIAELLKYGKGNDYVISDGLPHIPELLVRSEEVISRIIPEIVEYGKSDPKANVVRLTLAWSAFAGLGATYHWHINWNQLSNNGIFETLTQERGVYEMDEYVLDIIGAGYNSDDGDALRQHIFSAANICIAYILGQNEDLSLANVVEASTAMFIYGMVIEMNHLGMT